jgi:predicted metal-dependent hydrolase
MVQLRLPFGARPAPRSAPRKSGAAGRQMILLGRRPVVVSYVRHKGARHYVLSVQEDGSVRVTVPRGGSQAEAERFLREKAAWIERERYRAELKKSAAAIVDEARVLLRGEELPIDMVTEGNARVARFGGFNVRLAPGGRGPRPAIDRFLRHLAAQELPARLLELAGTLGRRVRGVSIRAQRTRWGSCSPTGRISLNWRLIHMPPSVCDYVLLHELTHLVHLNHSKRFWHELERVCPWHREARVWLKTRTSGGQGAR